MRRIMPRFTYFYLLIKRQDSAELDVVFSLVRSLCTTLYNITHVGSTVYAMITVPVCFLFVGTIITQC